MGLTCATDRCPPWGLGTQGSAGPPAPMLLLGVTTPPHPAPRTAPFSAATLKGFGRWLTVFLPPGPAPSRTLG